MCFTLKVNNLQEPIFNPIMSDVFASRPAREMFYVLAATAAHTAICFICDDLLKYKNPIVSMNPE